ncbi:MAG: alpha/beta hydrolase [Bacteroidetes bacterium]|nr:alpha/beta hydrolase [Bacteroidota bacterium]
MQIEYPFHTAHIDLESAGSVHYIDEGSGNETLLFIHGLANYALGWQKNIEFLRANFRCIAIDLPGNGLSEQGDFPYGIQYFADVVVHFIQKLKLSKVVLIGHSMGGQIAIRVLLNKPTIAKALVLCAPAGFEVFTNWEATMYENSISVLDFFSTEQNSLAKSIRSSFFHYTNQADKMIENLTRIMDARSINGYRKMLNACIHGMLTETVHDSLSQIKVPTCVMFGDRDALIPTRALHPTTTRAIAEWGTAQIPNAELHLLPQCGHFVQWEKSKEVNLLIQDFLARYLSASVATDMKH